MRFIFPIILIIASVGLFVIFTNPTYKQVATLRTEQAAYDEALTNSKQLLDIRQELVDKYNALSPDDRTKLSKLMPDNVDNIRLIIDIQKIASQYGMLPRDIRFDKNQGTTDIRASTPEEANQLRREYGTFDLDFSVTGTYANFLNFVRDLEKSLRIVDIESVTFASDANSSSYKYAFKIRTYWLRN